MIHADADIAGKQSVQFGSPEGRDGLRWERQMLAEHGHVLEQFLTSNASLGSGGRVQCSSGVCARSGLLKGYWEMGAAVDRVRPDVVHVHNTWAVLIPSIYWALARARVPCVLTLHNYRLICASSVLFRSNRPCEECVGRFPWKAFMHGCRYTGSLGVGSIAATEIVHNALGTYREKVSAFIVFSEFQKSLMVRAGLPAERVHVKPNFVTRPDEEGGPQCLGSPRFYLLA